MGEKNWHNTKYMIVRSCTTLLETLNIALCETDDSAELRDLYEARSYVDTWLEVHGNQPEQTVLENMKSYADCLRQRGKWVGAGAAAFTAGTVLCAELTEVKVLTCVAATFAVTWAIAGVSCYFSGKSMAASVQTIDKILKDKS